MLIRTVSRLSAWSYTYDNKVRLHHVRFFLRQDLYGVAGWFSEKSAQFQFLFAMGKSNCFITIAKVNLLV